MAKAPIIISNGGMASELAKGLAPATGRGEAWEIILHNVEELNKRAKKEEPPFPVAKSLDDKFEAKIIWRMSDEIKHSEETADAH